MRILLYPLINFTLLFFSMLYPLEATEKTIHSPDGNYKRRSPFYISMLLGSSTNGDFSSHSAESTLRIDQLGSKCVIGTALGINFNPNWRIELEARQRVGMRYQHFQESATTFSCGVGYLDSRTLALGAFYSLGKLANAEPYIGIGSGIGFNTLRKSDSLNNVELGITSSQPKSTRKNLIYFGRLGTRINFYKNIKIDLNYSFFHLGTAHTGRSAFGEISKLENIRLHEVVIGFIYEI